MCKVKTKRKINPAEQNEDEDRQEIKAEAWHKRDMTVKQSKTRNHKNRDKTLTLYNLTQRHTGKG